MVYDGIHVIAEVDSSGDLLKSYTWGPGIDNLLAFTTYTASETNTYYCLTDHLGTVHALTDDSGDVVESYRYDAWGRVIGVYDENNRPLEESAVGNHYLWQGRWYSWNTGLYYFRARWYDPITGRWLSKDPIGISGGLNQYVFAENNPVNFRDAFGLCKNGADDESYWNTALQGWLDWQAGVTDRAISFFERIRKMNSGPDILTSWQTPLFQNYADWALGTGNEYLFGRQSNRTGPSHWIGERTFDVLLLLAMGQARGGHGRGANKAVKDAAKAEGITDPVKIHRFGDYVENVAKRLSGRGGADHYTFGQLRELARQYIQEFGR